VQIIFKITIKNIKIIVTYLAYNNAYFS